MSEYKKRKMGENPEVIAEYRLLNALVKNNEYIDNPDVNESLFISETAKNLIKRNVLTIPELFVSASLNPAKVLGLSDRGQIKKGLRADLILLDDELNVQRVFKAYNPGLKMLSECSRCCN